MYTVSSRYMKVRDLRLSIPCAALPFVQYAQCCLMARARSCGCVAACVYRCSTQCGYICITVEHTPPAHSGGKMPLKIPIVAYIQQFISIILLVCGLVNGTKSTYLCQQFPPLETISFLCARSHLITSHSTHRCCFRFLVPFILRLLLFSSPVFARVYVRECVRACVLCTRYDVNNTTDRHLVRPSEHMLQKYALAKWICLRSARKCWSIKWKCLCIHVKVKESNKETPLRIK